MIQRCLELIALVAIAGCVGTVGPLGGDNPDASVFDDVRDSVTEDRTVVADVPTVHDATVTDRESPDVLELPPFAPAPARMRRLTVAQYQNSLRDLFGASIRVPTELEPDTALNGFAAVGAGRITISPRAVEQFEAAAYDVARQVMNDPVRRAALVGCTPSGEVDTTCARSFLTRFLRRAWRRPATDDELERVLTLGTRAATTLRGFWSGMEFSIAAALQSPNFLFRVELGEPDPTHAGRRRYTGYEIATRLSYLFWNTTPDDELLNAAQQGELVTREGVRTHAQRLLRSPRAREAFGTFVRELYDLDALSGIARDPRVYPRFTPTLLTSMMSETLRGFDELVFTRDTDWREIFDTRTTFVNAELAQLYGVTAPASDMFARVELPPNGPRAGLLGHASILALNAHATTTSPTLRGRFVRQVLLCQEIPPPPPDVSTQLPDPATGGTLRQRLAQHVSVMRCAGCHARMDPIGFGLEHFDSIGAARTLDNGLPIDATGTLDGVSFASGRELGRAIRGRRELGPCFARKLYRYATGHVEIPGEEIVLEDLAQRFVGPLAHRVQGLLVEVAASDGFRFAGEPQ